MVRKSTKIFPIPSNRRRTMKVLYSSVLIQSKVLAINGSDSANDLKADIVAGVNADLWHKYAGCLLDYNRSFVLCSFSNKTIRFVSLFTLKRTKWKARLLRESRLRHKSSIFYAVYGRDDVLLTTSHRTYLPQIIQQIFLPLISNSYWLLCALFVLQLRHSVCLPLFSSWISWHYAG